MTRYKRWYIALALVAVALFMAACGPFGSGGGSGGQSSLTALQVLQNSSKAMKQLKSAHVNLNVTESLQSTAPATPSAGTPVPSSISVNLTGKGDEAGTNKQSLFLTINQNTNVAEISLGDKLYVQNTKGQWYVLDKKTLQASLGNPFSGLNFDTNTLLSLIEHAKIIDHGDQSLNGQSLRHITAELDKEGLRQLLKSNSQLTKLFGQQNIDAVLDNTKSFQSTLDLWIDETQFYVHRTELKVNLTADLSSLSSTATATATGTPIVAIPSSVMTNLDSIVDLSNFNQPVTITAPANAIPTNDPGVIFGG